MGRVNGYLIWNMTIKEHVDTVEKADGKGARLIVIHQCEGEPKFEELN